MQDINKPAPREFSQLAELHVAGLFAGSMEQAINRLLRSSLTTKEATAPVKPFMIRSRKLGLPDGMSYDNIGELLEHLEGPLHR